MQANQKTAIIIGFLGQDGKILSKYLLDLNYRIIGLDKNKTFDSAKTLRKKINILDKDNVFSLIKKVKPDEIYYLAAFHKSSEEKELDAIHELEISLKINVLSLIYFLEGVRLFSPKSRMFYASSSLIFGNQSPIKKNEKTPRKPENIYGITKNSGTDLCKLYREKHGVFASVGILFNHESEYRNKNFVSMKIIKNALDIKNKKKKKLIIGNLSASVDWGCAHDYIKAIHLILQNNNPDDFIIASGKNHSIKDFIEITFKYLSLDWKKYVKEEQKIIKEKRQSSSGDWNKIYRVTGWRPETNFKRMIINIIKKVKYE